LLFSSEERDFARFVDSGLWDTAAEFEQKARKYLHGFCGTPTLRIESHFLPSISQLVVEITHKVFQ